MRSLRLLATLDEINLSFSTKKKYVFLTTVTRIYKKYGWIIVFTGFVGFPESRPFKIRVKLEIINFTQRIFYEKDTLYRTSNYFYPAGAGKGTKSI
jgi:hypothetical protein